MLEGVLLHLVNHFKGEFVHMPLREMDEIINPVCTLCRDHERSGFVHGVQIAMLLEQELEE